MLYEVQQTGGQPSLTAPRPQCNAASYAQALEFWKNRQPSPTLPPTHVIGLLMAALQKNDDPSENEGLRTVRTGRCVEYVRKSLILDDRQHDTR